MKAKCSAVLLNFATSPVMIPLAWSLRNLVKSVKVMELTAFSGGAFYTLQIQGLACLVMGACIMSDNEARRSSTSNGLEGRQRLHEPYLSASNAQKPERVVLVCTRHRHRSLPAKGGGGWLSNAA